MSGTKKSGLGRGLSSLIPTSQTEEANNLDRRQRVLRSMVDASFDLIEERHNVALAAYLHVAHNDEPLLFLHRPSFSTLTPTTGFRLFHQIAQLSNSTPSIGPFVLEDWNGIYLRSSGTMSDGIHLFAQTTHPFEQPTVRSIERITTAAASVVHQVETAHDVSDIPQVRLIVEVAGAETTVEAAITDADGTRRCGRGSAMNAEEAVVRSVLDAATTTLEFSAVTDVADNDGRAVLTTLVESDGTPRFGLAIGDSDTLGIAASSALRALR